jgi:hypothetical protein
MFFVLPKSALAICHYQSQNYDMSVPATGHPFLYTGFFAGQLVPATRPAQVRQRTNPCCILAPVPAQGKKMHNIKNPVFTKSSYGTALTYA